MKRLLGATKDADKIVVLPCYDKTKEGGLIFTDAALLFLPSNGGQ
jgi:hypothetical protein